MSRILRLWYLLTSAYEWDGNPVIDPVVTIDGHVLTEGWAWRRINPNTLKPEWRSMTPDEAEEMRWWHLVR